MAADWKWEDTPETGVREARRGPVRALLYAPVADEPWEWWVGVYDERDDCIAWLFDGRTAGDEADARRAAETAADAFGREVAETLPDEALAEMLRARGWAVVNRAAVVEALAEADADAMTTEGQSCGAIDPEQWICTRSPGHDGPHVASDSLDIYARWP